MAEIPGKKRISPAQRVSFSLAIYADSFKRHDATILANLEAIIELKKQHLKKIFLLLGNHDVQYLHYPKY